MNNNTIFKAVVFVTALVLMGLVSWWSFPGDVAAPAVPDRERTGVAGQIDDAADEATEVVEAAGEAADQVGGAAVDTLNEAADTYQAGRDALDRFRRR